MAIAFDKIQGDILGQGFPKFNETFFFFSIIPTQVPSFCSNLKALASVPAGSSPSSPSLSTVSSLGIDRNTIATNKGKTPPINNTDLANANIAFSKTGLAKVRNIFETWVIANI
jgi:hypothetical protein